MRSHNQYSRGVLIDSTLLSSGRGGLQTLFLQASAYTYANCSAGWFPIKAIRSSNSQRQRGS
ncbi:hypothetical protein CCHR01_17533 [Colletotrichum chrysophilum]|uniref:Uncharacterized protein n=1 Tax=Colletotrichum chrysophilum TaxID=1836956 RepID=A0AAD9E9G7_9PEZI|nr:hypothetical protein CCHR01_17533 [Colletotrichum chrysophilum]